MNKKESERSNKEIKHAVTNKMLDLLHFLFKGTNISSQWTLLQKHKPDK